MSKTIRKFTKKEVRDSRFSDKPMPKPIQSNRKGQKKQSINDMIEEIMEKGTLA